MKNSILTVLAVAAMVSCNKKETTTADNSSDTMMMTNSDSMTTLDDSATTAGTMGTENSMLAGQNVCRCSSKRRNDGSNDGKIS